MTFTIIRIDISQEWFDKFSQILNTYKNTLITDFNAHHTSWRCFKSDCPGRVLLSITDVNVILINNGIINNGNPTLLTPSRTNKSVIDITITSANLAPLCEITTESDTFDSDFPNIVIGGFSCLWHVFLYKLILDTNKANKLYHYLLSISEEFFSKISIDSSEAYEYFADHLRNFTRLLFSKKQRLHRSIRFPLTGRVLLGERKNVPRSF